MKLSIFILACFVILQSVSAENYNCLSDAPNLYSLVAQQSEYFFTTFNATEFQKVNVSFSVTSTGGGPLRVTLGYLTQSYNVGTWVTVYTYPNYYINFTTGGYTTFTVPYGTYPAFNILNTNLMSTANILVTINNICYTDGLYGSDEDSRDHSTSDIHNNKGLSDGAIIAIVVVSAIVVGIIVAITVHCIKKHHHHHHHHHHGHHEYQPAYNGSHY
ncbi:putative importin subunit alpha C [Tieghemostelium lacteum]|uniref:Putative importin subunit alpha C n=1 Tax=Tieghemostelium lacteum TaxID=361077 RepID=A0A151Z3J9_TIELA|nr:putative importin subunit alpha C [Tieghemostelium lacteum]|eukprot:KYQ88518.1 putative importin subunit alpha C [Tieghemostelium lacteum]